MIAYAVDVALKLIVFGWFSYAKQHFANSKKVPVGMTAVKLSYAVGLAVNLWLVFRLDEEQDLHHILGLIATVLAAIVFYYALRASSGAGLHVAFSDLTGASLVSSGIYRYVRHPFYLSYVIYWFSWCVSLGFHLAPVAVLVVLLVLYIASIRLEERELEHTFGDEYRAYKKRTSLLIPYIL